MILYHWNNIRLQLNLGHQLLVFASTTNLESGPRFANICWNSNGLMYFKCFWAKWTSFCPTDTKWQPFVWISNVPASKFQIPFKIRTNWNPTSFSPFKIQTSPDFRPPLYYLASKRLKFQYAFVCYSDGKCNLIAGRTPVAVVSAGVKSILDIAKTLQYLVSYLLRWFFFK